MPFRPGPHGVCDLVIRREITPVYLERPPQLLHCRLQDLLWVRHVPQRLADAIEQRFSVRTSLFLSKQSRPFILSLMPCCHVGLDADKVSEYAARVPHWGDCHFIPENRPVFAVVQKQVLARLLLLNGIAQFSEDGPVGLRSLKKAAVAPDHLRFGIARHGKKCGVRVNKRAIRQARICDHNAVGGGSNSPVADMQIA